MIFLLFLYHSEAMLKRSLANSNWETTTDRQITARAARQKAAALLPLSDLATALSFLEMRSVTGVTRQVYMKHVRLFIEWCLRHRYDWSGPEELDALLVLLFDELFFKGFAADSGTRVFTAIAFFLPAVSKAGQWALPRAFRSLRGWRLAAPPRERLPLPRAVIAALVGAACHAGKLASGLKWWLQLRTYLRPGEIDKLEVFQLIPPTPAAGPQFRWFSIILSPPELETPGKTGLWDESVMIDRDPELIPLLATLVQGRPPADPLWGRSADDADTFRAMVDLLGLEALRPCRYAIRHGGASDDLLTNFRDLIQIKTRGRWVADASLKRYAKESKLAAELRKVDPRILAYGLAVEKDLAGVLSGFRPLPPPLLP